METAPARIMDDRNTQPDRIPSLSHHLGSPGGVTIDPHRFRLAISPSDLTWPNGSIDQLIQAILTRWPGAVVPWPASDAYPDLQPLRCSHCKPTAHGLDACHRPDLDPLLVYFVCRACRRVLASISALVPPPTRNAAHGHHGPLDQSHAGKAPPGPTGGPSDPDCSISGVSHTTHHQNRGENGGSA